jgi:hypothetical protein
MCPEAAAFDGRVGIAALGRSLKGGKESLGREDLVLRFGFRFVGEMASRSGQALDTGQILPALPLRRCCFGDDGEGERFEDDHHDKRARCDAPDGVYSVWTLLPR